MAEKPSVAPGVYLFMEQEGKNGPEALFMHRSDPNGQYLSGTHMPPGGGVEANEPPLVATVRETWEELRAKLDLADLVFEHVMFRGPHDATGNRVDIFFRIRKWTGEPVINEPHKCGALAWLPLNDLPETVPEYIRVAVQHILQGTRYSEFDWPARE